MDKINYTPFYKSYKPLSLQSYIPDWLTETIGYTPQYNIALKEETEDSTQVTQEPPKQEIKSHKSIFKDKTDFINTMLPIYKKVLKENGLNEDFAKSLVAQCALESNWGKSQSGKFNFGGIKGNGTIRRTREVIDGKDVYINDSFRDFDSLEDYVRYHVNLLNGKRYQAFSGNVNDFAQKVTAGGYATDPKYKEVLQKVIRSVKHGGVLSKAPLFYKTGGSFNNSSVIKAQNGRLMKELVTRINNTSNADFVKRLKDLNRTSIHNWENVDDHATHKLGYVTNGDTSVVFPWVQNINGTLHDFTDPRYNHNYWDAYDRAVETGDTLNMSPRQAKIFTRNYKKYYPKFKTGGYIDNNVVKAQDGSNDGFWKLISDLQRIKRWQKQHEEVKNLGVQYSHESKGWTDDDLKFLHNTFENNKFGLNNVLKLMSTESSWNPKVRNENSSASGLFQITRATTKRLRLPDEAWRQYENGTRSIQDQIKDASAFIDIILNNIPKNNADSDKLTYGRLKVNWLAPNASLDQHVSNEVYENSLSKKMKPKVTLGKTTYRDLMNLYDNE